LQFAGGCSSGTCASARSFREKHALDEGYAWDTEMTGLAEGDINPTAIAG
jgi:hypothetical protein